MNNGEHKSDWFLKMNPSHKVPVLKDGKQNSRIDFGDECLTRTVLATMADLNGAQWTSCGDG